MLVLFVVFTPPQGWAQSESGGSEKCWSRYSHEFGQGCQGQIPLRLQLLPGSRSPRTPRSRRLHHAASVRERKGSGLSSAARSTCSRRQLLRGNAFHRHRTAASCGSSGPTSSTEGVFVHGACSCFPTIRFTVDTALEPWPDVATGQGRSYGSHGSSKHHTFSSGEKSPGGSRCAHGMRSSFRWSRGGSVCRNRTHVLTHLTKTPCPG